MCVLYVCSRTFTVDIAHLEMLESARAQQCPWVKRARAYAAMNGHIEVSEWTSPNGCP
jgi:hypothetical protein